MPDHSLVLLGGASVATMTVASLLWRTRVLQARLRRHEASSGPFASSTAGDPQSASAADHWMDHAAAGAIDLLWDWDLPAERLRLSPRWSEFIGMASPAGDETTARWWGRVHPSDRAQLDADIAAQLASPDAHFTTEHRIRHEDGHWLHVQWHGRIARDANGRALRVSGSARDVTAQRREEERRRREALYDAVTDLPNRALATDLLRRAIQRTRRQGERRFAVLLVDLDRFNLLNDSLGQAAGDELLKGVAARLATAIRPGDLLARLAGDAFLLLLDEISDVEDAEGVADRVKLVLAEPIEAFTHSVVVTASLGIVLHDPDLVRPEDYLRDAELAMHEAKRAGRARHVTFAPAMRDGVRRRVSVEQDLRGAIDRQEFGVVYQPIWDMSGPTETLMGFEALVRWHHPRRGTLGAGEFVPIAEESDLIVALGSWAMHRACRELVDFAPNGPTAPWVSVNLAARQLADRGLVGLVDTVLGATGLDATRLRLEVTENVVLHDEAGARQMLDMLRVRGVRSLMDDFGTGHASLSYLHRLPIGTIKIDRYFVGRMDVSPECLEIVRSIIALARSLGMDVVAEGVEQEAQLAQLRTLGCQAVQGFLLARPLNAEEAIALLAALAGRPDDDARGIVRELGLTGGLRRTLED